MMDDYYYTDSEFDDILESANVIKDPKLPPSEDVHRLKTVILKEDHDGCYPTFGKGSKNS